MLSAPEDRFHRIYRGRNTVIQERLSRTSTTSQPPITRIQNTSHAASLKSFNGCRSRLGSRGLSIPSSRPELSR